MAALVQFGAIAVVKIKPSPQSSNEQYNPSPHELELTDALCIASPTSTLLPHSDGIDAINLILLHDASDPMSEARISRLAYAISPKTPHLKSPFYDVLQTDSGLTIFYRTSSVANSQGVLIILCTSSPPRYRDDVQPINYPACLEILNLLEISYANLCNNMLNSPILPIDMKTSSSSISPSITHGFVDVLALVNPVTGVYTTKIVVSDEGSVAKVGQMVDKFELLGLNRDDFKGVTVPSPVQKRGKVNRLFAGFDTVDGVGVISSSASPSVVSPSQVVKVKEDRTVIGDGRPFIADFGGAETEEVRAVEVPLFEPMFEASFDAFGEDDGVGVEVEAEIDDDDEEEEGEEALAKEPSEPPISLQIVIDEDFTYNNKDASSILEGTIKLQTKENESTSPNPARIYLTIEDADAIVSSTQPNTNFATPEPSTIANMNLFNCVMPRVSKLTPLVKFRSSHDYNILKVQTKLNYADNNKLCRMSIQISSNPAFQISLTGLTCTLKVDDKKFNGASVKTIPSGGVYDREKGLVQWRLEGMTCGEKQICRVQLEVLEGGRGEGGGLPIVIRGFCTEKRVTNTKVEVNEKEEDGEGNKNTPVSNVSVTNRLRITYNIDP